MITLITGVPGSGKSLSAVKMILDNSRSDSIRPLYTNINGIDFNALKCFPLPDDLPDFNQYEPGSIFVIDECQRFYPPRPSGSPVPDRIKYFNVHRHYGHDFVLITQYPKLIDNALRALVGRHIHISRPFNMKKTYQYEWSHCNDSPEPSSTESNALKTPVVLDKRIFRFYKSTELDTHSSHFPIKKVVFLVSVLLIAVLLFFFGFYNFFHNADKNVKSAQKTINSGVKLPSVSIKRSKPSSSSLHYKFIGSVSGDGFFRIFTSPASRLTDFRSYVFYNNNIYLSTHPHCTYLNYDLLIPDSNLLPYIQQYLPQNS